MSLLPYLLYLINERECSKFVEHGVMTTVKNHFTFSKRAKLSTFKFLNCYNFKTRTSLKKLVTFKCFSCIEEDEVQVFKSFSKTAEWEIFCYTTPGAFVYRYDIRSLKKKSGNYVRMTCIYLTHP